MMRALRNLRNWLAVRDFDEAREASTRRVVSRFARGNTSMQNGWYIDEPEFSRLVQKGDRAMADLRRMINAAKKSAQKNPRRD